MNSEYHCKDFNFVWLHMFYGLSTAEFITLKNLFGGGTYVTQEMAHTKIVKHSHLVHRAERTELNQIWGKTRGSHQ